jgi:hypothetical protein
MQMSRHKNTRHILVTAAVRAGWAGALLLVPAQSLRAGGRAPASAVAVARILGLRHLAQAAASALAPTAPVAGLGAVIDTLHTGTCIGLAVMSPRWRRVALLDAAVETGFAASGWRSGGPPASRRRTKRRRTAVLRSTA